MIGWILGLGAGSVWVWKKHPDWLPKPLRPSARKNLALAAVTRTSNPTPSATAGLDPGMSSAEVAAANGLLQQSSDPDALYAMASDYSARDFVKTSEALIAKADALKLAQQHGASDDEIYAQMMAATGATNAAATDVSQVYSGGGEDLGEEVGQNLR